MDLLYTILENFEVIFIENQMQIKLRVLSYLFLNSSSCLLHVMFSVTSLMNILACRDASLFYLIFFS